MRYGGPSARRRFPRPPRRPFRRRRARRGARARSRAERELRHGTLCATRPAGYCAMRDRRPRRRGMTDKTPLLGDGPNLEELAIEIGLHLRKAEELCVASAGIAKEAGEEVWTAFFNAAKEEMGAALKNAGRALPTLAVGCRPPF